MIAVIKHIAETTFNKKNGYWWDSEVVYGDTDSIFVALHGFCDDVNDPQERALAHSVGAMMAKYITKKAFGSYPCRVEDNQIVCLEYEKLYTNFNLIGPKNYCGCKWMAGMKKPKKDMKGLEMIKRGTPPYIGQTCQKITDMLIMQNDIEGAIKYAAKRFDALRAREVSCIELTKSMKINDDLDHYGQTTEYFDKDGKKQTKTTSESPFVVLAKRQRQEEIDSMIAEETVKLRKFYRDKHGNPDAEKDPATKMKKKVAEEDWINDSLKEKKKNFKSSIGAGSIISLVFTAKDAEYGKAKSKKGADNVEDPLVVLKNNIPVDYDYYYNLMKNQVVKIMHNPIVKLKNPIVKHFTTMKSFGIKSKDDKSNHIIKMEDLISEKNSAGKELRKKEREANILSQKDIVDDKKLQDAHRHVAKLKSRKKEINAMIKSLNAQYESKVMEIIEGLCVKAKKQPEIQKTSAMFRFVKPPEKCIVCQTKLDSDAHDPKEEELFRCIDCGKTKEETKGLPPNGHTCQTGKKGICRDCRGPLGKCKHRRAKGRRNVCQHCDGHIEILYEKEVEDLVRLDEESEDIWLKCMKCMDASLEEVRRCVNTNCLTLGARHTIEEKLKNQNAKVNDIKNAYPRILDW